MANPNDARPRVRRATGAIPRSHAARDASAPDGHDAVDQGTGVMPPVGATARRSQVRGAHATPDLSTSLPTLNVEDVQQPLGAPVVTFDHVTMVYQAQPNKPSLHDISVKIYPGEFIFLVGHSGSGKSTFRTSSFCRTRPSSRTSRSRSRRSARAVTSSRRRFPRS